jgi:hypothetical protein
VSVSIGQSNREGFQEGPRGPLGFRRVRIQELVETKEGVSASALVMVSKLVENLLFGQSRDEGRQ